jgi:hypothetical protein
MLFINLVNQVLLDMAGDCAVTLPFPKMQFLLPFFLLFLTVLGTDVPILLDGALVDVTATDDSYNTGGTISVNGWTVIVPKNMLVTFPAAFVPWKDFVAGKASVIGFEVNVS